MPAKNSRKGLGKGLDALIAPNQMDKVKSTKKSGANEKASGDGVVMVKINKVEPNKKQPRKNFDEAALEELADSIKQFGIIQPVVVQKKGDYYEIIAGERRWRAAKVAKLKEIPVVIKDYTEQEIMEIALIENIQREDLNPIEESLAYKRLIDEYKLKQEDIAKKLSKSRTVITNSLRLLKLSKVVQEMLINGELSSGHARTLVVIEDEKKQEEFAYKIIKEKLSVRETEKLIQNFLVKKGKKTVKKENKNDFAYRDIEERLKDITGTKVKINNKANGKGKIEIEYYSDDDLERIFDMFLTLKR
ncbi:chromosome partitioning protein, ParB family [Lachnospiraceae bacterium RM5]|nr:chromosome partitioning protein, ParB family [Lachnospiraceae bacterium RM5]